MTEETDRLATTFDECVEILEEVGLPCIVSSAFAIGRCPPKTAHNWADFESAAKMALLASCVSQVRIESCE